MDQDWTGGLWVTQTAHNINPYSHANWPRCTILTRNRCFQVCHRGSVISTVQDKWHPVGFTSKKPLGCWEKLQDPQQRASISHPRPGIMEAHLGRNLKHNRDPEWPQNFWTSQNLNYWQAHWSLLAWFNFSLIHRPGWPSTNQMPSHNGQTIWLREKITMIRWCYWAIGSTNCPSWVNH